MSAPSVATVYAEALFELAVERDKRATIVEQATELVAVLREEPGILAGLRHPTLTPDARQTLIRDLFSERVERELVDLVALLAERGRLDHLVAVLAAVGECDRRERGLVRLEVASAVPLEPALRERCGSALRAVHGASEIAFCVEPELLGGLRVRRDGELVVDASVQRHLERLYEQVLAVPAQAAWRAQEGGA
ncbi:MAG: ATP synthase F1 subunit delta [Planctomycetota bacterium]